MAVSKERDNANVIGTINSWAVQNKNRKIHKDFAM